MLQQATLQAPELKPQQKVIEELWGDWLETKSGRHSGLEFGRSQKQV